MLFKLFKPFIFICFIFAIYDTFFGATFSEFCGISKSFCFSSRLFLISCYIAFDFFIEQLMNASRFVSRLYVFMDQLLDILG